VTAASRPTFAPGPAPALQGRRPADAPAGQHGATGAPLPPRSAAPLPAGSALDAQVKLARLADLFAEASGIVRELSEVQLANAPERALMSSVNATAPKLLTARDVAARVGVDERTVRRWRREGKMPRGIELGESVVRWTSESIEAWIGGAL